MPNTYLITGAARGLGKGLVAAYLRQTDNVVIAAVRNPDDSNSQLLQQLPRAQSTILIVVKINSTSTTDAEMAVERLRSEYNITSLDVVIANAGMAQTFPRVESAAAIDMLNHYQVNAIGVVILLQAVLPLLRKSRKVPKFIAMSSETGTVGNQEKFEIPNAVYGPTKAALNWILKKVHMEHEDLIAFPAHPGFVQTDMGNDCAQEFGIEDTQITLEESIAGLVDVIDNATRDSTGGKFAFWNGSFGMW